MKYLLVISLLLSLGSIGRAEAIPAEKRLATYRAELETLRKDFGGARNLPDVPFYLFGMGQRTKLFYQNGTLRNAVTGAVLHKWKTGSELIVPADYEVLLTTADQEKIRIHEDETAVWIEAGGKRTAIPGTTSPLKLPVFQDRKFPGILRVLHHELLMNVMPAGPVPNFYVYQKPWYRDGAMMAMAFKQTGNLEVIRAWIMGLNEVYDRNNKGETEADNLGQALYLVSLVSDKNHPLVAKVMAEIPRFEKNEGGIRFIKGRSDFSEHPAYQTKWLKYGLRALGLPDPYTIPKVADSYSALFWMDYKDSYVAGKDHENRDAYPYLGWACDHFHGTRKSPLGNRDYPLTWEQKASEADYRPLAIIDPIYVSEKLSAPHTWHGAEAFLYLLEMK